MKRQKKKAKLPKIGRRVIKNEFELKLYKQIKNLKGPKDKLEYETEQVPYTIDYVYEPDFIITRKDGSKLYVEAKGNGRAWTPQVQRKMIAVKQQHPDLDIRIVFFSDGAMGQRRKDGSFRRQSDWATQHGFPFAIRDVPKEWLEDKIV